MRPFAESLVGRILDYAKMQLIMHILRDEMNLSAPSVVYDRIKKSRKLSALTQSEIAFGAKVHQSQVSRILNGDFQRVSGNVMQICKFADILFTDAQPISPKLQKAVERVWDGSRAQEAAIVKLLGAAGGIALANAAKATQRSRGKPEKRPRK